MLHIVANVQVSKGNRDNASIVSEHVKTFINTIEKNTGCSHSIKFYQKQNHKNFRNVILPEYKGHRTPSEAILVWKPTILRAFEEAGAVGLDYIESDDAISLLAEYFNPACLIVSSDKDMKQVAGNHYNPYKQNLSIEDRFFSVTTPEAFKFLYQQVLSGDPTDMPGELCGIEGVGLVTSLKILDSFDAEVPYTTIIQKAYTKHYKGKEAFKRANVTYKMVKLLTKYGNDYINSNLEAKAECESLLADNCRDLIVPIVDSVSNLFEEPQKINLFKKD